MAAPPESYAQHPTIAEISRRVERLERIAEGRVVTIDVYAAEKAAHTIEITAMNHRLNNIEESLQSATRLLIGAFLTIIGQGIFLAITTFGR
jgi:hypothetical protein